MNAAIRAELRFLRDMVVFISVIIGVFVAANAIGNWAHLPIAAELALASVAFLAIGYVALSAWLRRHASARRMGASSEALPSTTARYAPFVVQCALLLWLGNSLVSQLQAAIADHWHSHMDSFALLGLSTGFAVFSTVRSAREIREPTLSAVSPNEGRRMQQTLAAFALPERERRVALKPIQRRGYVRLGLLVGGIVGMVALEPVVGPSWAAVIAITIVSSIFLIGVRFFDL